MLHTHPPGVSLAPSLALSLLALGCGGLPGVFQQDEPPADRAPGDLTPWLGNDDAEPLAQYPSAPLETRDGALWFCTAFSGAIRFQDGEFTRFRRKDGLPSDTIRAILEDNTGRLWLGTGGGVCWFDGERFVPEVDSRGVRVTRTFAADGDHRDVWDVEIDREGTMWVAAMDGVFRSTDGAFERFALPVEGAPGAYEFGPRMVYSIFQDTDGALWFGTDGAGAVRYANSSFEVLTVADGLCSDRVCEILRDRRGDLWFGTSSGGVSRFDGDTFTTHLRTEEHSEITGWGRYMAILEDSRGHVWFGASMAGGGAHRWDGASWRAFGADDGLGTGAIPSLSKDRSGHLWFGTTAGVYRFDGERFEHFAEMPR